MIRKFAIQVWCLIALLAGLAVLGTVAATVAGAAYVVVQLNKPQPGDAVTLTPAEAAEYRQISDEIDRKAKAAGLIAE